MLQVTFEVFVLHQGKSETMLGIGATELMIVGFIAWMLFGKRLPHMVRSLGVSVKEFQKGLHNIEDDIGGRPA